MAKLILVKSLCLLVFSKNNYKETQQLLHGIGYLMEENQPETER
jgi:hypothetical protein